MRFAYADPPYHGMGQALYGALHDNAADWDSQDTHLNLITRLSEDYPDGWALSLNPRDLVWQLPACPPDVRVGSVVQDVPPDPTCGGPVRVGTGHLPRRQGHQGAESACA